MTSLEDSLQQQVDAGGLGLNAVDVDTLQSVCVALPDLNGSGEEGVDVDGDVETLDLRGGSQGHLPTIHQHSSFQQQ